MTDFRLSIFDFRFFKYAPVHKRRAFTLIELLAVTALIGLLAGMTIVRYAKMGSQTVLINQTRQIYLAAKYARITAVEKQKPYLLQYDAAGRQIIVGPLPQDQLTENTSEVSTSTAMELMEPESPVVKNSYVKPIELDNKLQMEQFLVDGQTAETQCVFFPDGSAQACVIQLGDGFRHACVFVTQTGRAQMRMEAAQQLQSGRTDLDITE